MGEGLGTDGSGSWVLRAEGVGGGERKATFFWTSVPTVVALVFALRRAEGSGSCESVGVVEVMVKPTPLSSSQGSSMGGKGRAQMSGRGLWDEVEVGVPVLVLTVPALLERWICVELGVGCLVKGSIESLFSDCTCGGGHPGRGGSWTSSRFSRLGDEWELVEELSLRSLVSMEELSRSFSLSFSLSFDDRPLLNLFRNAFMTRTCVVAETSQKTAASDENKTKM